MARHTRRARIGPDGVTRLRVLVTGGTGRLAKNWRFALEATHDVMLAGRGPALPAPGGAVLTLDDPSVIAHTLDRLRPDMVIHAAAMTDVEACEIDPVTAHRVNVELAHHVATACRSTSVPLVHISTDHLFSAAGPYFAESDEPEPLNVYASTKAAAEREVLCEYPEALVVRTNFFGFGVPGRPTMNEWILQSLRADGPVMLFEDVHFSPVFAINLAHDVDELVRCAASGIVNIASSDRISKYDFGRLLAQQFGYPDELIVPSRIADRNDLVNRPREMALAVDRFEALVGRRAKSVREHIEDLAYAAGTRTA